MSVWFVYLLECVADGTLYAGATTDVTRRVHEHSAGVGARYTRGRRPVRLVWWMACQSHGAALNEERRIKRLSRAGKAALVKVSGCAPLIVKGLR